VLSVFNQLHGKTNKIVDQQIPSKDEDFEMAEYPDFVSLLHAGAD
jgi:hypothetical protein